MTGRTQTILLFTVVVLTCFGCDQATKELARTHLEGALPQSFLWGTVQLIFAENPGGFLSLGSGLPEFVRTFAFVIGPPIVLLLMAVLLLRDAAFSNRDAFALALIVGGGAGNWLDRILRDGLVTDFMRIGVGPVHTGIFNAADSAIMLGAGLLILSSLRGRKPPEVQESEPG